MGSRKRKDNITSRRRTDDDGEDESGSLEGGNGGGGGGGGDDSSIDTLISDADGEADVDEDRSEANDSPKSRRKSSKKANGNQNGSTDVVKQASEQDSTKQAPAFSNVSADTLAMMNGLNIKDDTEGGQAIQFGQLPAEVPTASATVDEKSETLAEKRRREHEEYKLRRDQDPAFVPNRGGFFMHDSRSPFSGPNGFRDGRGRGRGGRGGLPFR